MILIDPRAVISYQPMQHPSFARKAEANSELTILGPEVMVGPFALLYAGAKIGGYTVINPYAAVRENARIGTGCIIGQKAQIGHDCVIGNDVRIMDCAHISGECTIGDGTFVGPHVCMANDDSPQGYKFKGLTPVHVGKNCLIGSNATLRAGIVIGDGAIIAAGAIVVKDVPAGAKVKGWPAR